MDKKIKIETLTFDKLRQLRWISLPKGMNKIINVNTYYRVINNKNKNKPQKRTILKICWALWISEKTFDILLKNQRENELEKNTW